LLVLMVGRLLLIVLHAGHLLMVMFRVLRAKSRQEECGEQNR
jgi:hypothetical protein